MLAVFGLVLLLTIGAFIAAIVFVIRAAVEKRKGADHGRALKHCYIALGTFGGGFVLLMVIAAFLPTPNATASAAPTAKPRKVAIAQATPTPSPVPTPSATPTPTPTAEATDGDLVPGDLATVNTNDLSCYPSTNELDAALKAIAAKDKVGFREHTEGIAIILQSGQHVRVIDMGGFMGAADRQIRIESGDSTGQACWVSSDDAHFFSDIHEDKS